MDSRPLPQLIPAKEFGGRLDGRWVVAEDLRVGDELFVRNGELTLVDAISIVNQELVVYNIHVEELENYSIGHRQILVHNTNNVPEEIVNNLEKTKNLPSTNAERRAAEQAANEYIAKKFGPLEAPGGAITKSNSPVWKDLDPYRGQTKTNGLSGKKKQYYEWDHTHNDIEVYDSAGRHLGSMDPTTGQMIKPPVKGRTIDLD